jgi:hypothetical protein
MSSLQATADLEALRKEHALELDAAENKRVEQISGLCKVGTSDIVLCRARSTWVGCVCSTRSFCVRLEQPRTQQKGSPP